MKVFVAVVVIAAFCVVLITAITDEQNKTWTKELNNKIEKINTAVADLTKREVTWVAQVNEDLNLILSNSLPDIIDLFEETFENIKVMANDTNVDATSCLKSASSDIAQNILDVTAALNETRDTALDTTYIQQTIDSTMRYSNTIFRQLNSTLEHLDCLGPKPDNPDYCLVLSKLELDRNVRFLYDEVARIILLIGDQSMSAYSAASEARDSSYQVASQNAKIVEENAVECLASL